MFNKKIIKSGLIIGMVCSLMLALICIIYGIITIINFFSPIIILIIIYGLFQIIPFLLCLNVYNNKNQLLFITGIVSLFSFLLPGILILVGYFRKQKDLLNNKKIIELKQK